MTFLKEQAPSTAAAAVFSPDHPHGHGGRVVASVDIRVTIEDVFLAGYNTMTLSSVATPEFLRIFFFSRSIFMLVMVHVNLNLAGTSPLQAAA